MKLPIAASITITLLALGCGKEQPAGEPATPRTPAASGAVTPDAAGKVITIEMTTDDKGVNKFMPSTVEAKAGDVLRFTLVTGVHNAHFHVDENPAGAELPPIAPLLQLPGQTWDVKVNWKEGTYKFMCEPHALLGMKGEIQVRG